MNSRLIEADLIATEVKMAVGRSSLMTAYEVAGHLGISPKTVYEYAQRGLLPCVRIGDRLVRFRGEDLERYVEHSRSPEIQVGFAAADEVRSRGDAEVGDVR